MPRTEDLGKDKVIFMTKEELSEPSKLDIPEPEPQPGLILPDGSINWNCPCLGGMATGPCGVQFRAAFSCFHYSTAEPKGSNCVEAFTTMQSCMQKYPTLYQSSRDEDEEGGAFPSGPSPEEAFSESQQKDTGQDQADTPEKK